MREYQSTSDRGDIGYGRTSDIDPLGLGWAILLAVLAIIAWKRLGKAKSIEDALGYMAVLGGVGVIALLVTLGNRF